MLIGLENVRLGFGTKTVILPTLEVLWMTSGGFVASLAKKTFIAGGGDCLRATQQLVIRAKVDDECVPNKSRVSLSIPSITT